MEHDGRGRIIQPFQLRASREPWVSCESTRPPVNRSATRSFPLPPFAFFLLLLLARAPRHRTRPHPHPQGNTSTLTRHSTVLPIHLHPTTARLTSVIMHASLRVIPGRRPSCLLLPVGVILTVALDWVRIMSLVNLANRQQRLENQVSRQLKHYQTPLYH